MSPSRRTQWFLLGLALLVITIVVHDVLRSDAPPGDVPSVEPPRIEGEPRRRLDKTPLLYSSEYMRSLAKELEPALVTAWPDVATGLRAPGCFIAPDGEVLVALRAAATRWHVLPGGGRPIQATLVGADTVHGVGLLRAAVDRPVPFVRFHTPSRTAGGDALVGLVAGRGAADLRLLVAPGAPETLSPRLAREPLDPGEVVTTLDGELVAFAGGQPAHVQPLTVDELVGIVSSLRAEGRHPHPWIGVELQTIDASLRRHFSEGSIVAVHVVPGSPAARAGVRPGMVFTEAAIGGRTTTTAGAVRAMLFPGGDVRLVRPGRSRPIVIRVEDRQFRTGSGEPGDLAIRPLIPEPGVPIRVGLAGEAALAGLEDGDVIEAVDLRPVPSPTQLRRLLSPARNHLLTVRRGDERFFVSLPPGGAAAGRTSR